MSTAPSSDPRDKNVPPDPGGRSRYLVRFILIACLLGAAIVIVLMLALHRATPPPTPNQVPQNGSSSLVLLAVHA